MKDAPGSLVWKTICASIMMHWNDSQFILIVIVIYVKPFQCVSARYMILIFNSRHNIWNRVKKSREIGQDQKNLIFVFA